MQKARQACQAALRQGKTCRGGIPGALRLQGTYAWLRGKPTTAHLWWQRSLTVAEELGARYELGLTSLEMGRRLGDQEHLERAEAIWTDIGVTMDLV